MTTTSLLELLRSDGLAATTAAGCTTSAKAIDRYRNTILSLVDIPRLSLLSLERTGEFERNFVKSLLKRSTS